MIRIRFAELTAIALVLSSGAVYYDDATAQTPAAQIPASPSPSAPTNAATPMTSSSPNEVKAPGQPFEHPSDDKSYAKDMRDDEMLAKSKPVSNGAVQYVSGGIAQSGMRAIDAEESNYNLKILFVSTGGEYLANVGVKISGNKGTVMLNTTATGPVLLAKLPAGHYTVTTKTSGGTILTRHIKTSSDHLDSYVFRYQAQQNN